MKNSVKSLKISSTVFNDNGPLPEQYGCKGAGINPPLNISGIPGTTRTLTLIMEDPDAPGKTFDHWIVINIPPVDRITENSVPGTALVNSKQTNVYHPPCPPSGTHRYIFTIYALDVILLLDETHNKTAVQKAMQEHILAEGTITGLYSND